ncbi:MAG: GH36-type glycosyl hydrolase domain-containing protein [Candidatus Eiseniibacteriota bacterium]
MTHEASSGAGAGPRAGAGVRAPTGAFLTNGRWTTFITASGLSATWLGDVALTRFRPDPIESHDGIHFYLRDIETREMDSATFEPVRRPAERDEFVLGGADGRAAVIRRERGGLASELAIEVDSEQLVERRRLTLTNTGAKARRLEVAAALEVVLLEAAADAAHPAFAKLFVQTEWVADREILVARRRPRSATERHPWLACALVASTGPDARAGAVAPWTAGVEWETDRARFLGRGGSPGRPDALVSGEPLSGTVGSVLDPVFCLRRRVVLEPGRSASIALVVAAGDTREKAIEAVAAPATKSSPSITALRLPRDARATWETSFPAPPVQAGRSSRAARAAGPHAATPEPTAAVTEATEELQFWNGYGGFSADGKEYVIRLVPDATGRLRRPPAPWTNVIANERIGFLVSETGASCTWTRNSREHRLTPWSNDPVLDPHGEALYLRDEETGEFWSPLAGPCPARAPYEVRHGFGRTVVRTTSHGLEQETTLFVARTDAIKLANLRITNRTNRTRRLSAFAYHRLVLGGRAEDDAGAIVTAPGPRPGSLTATSARDPLYADGIAFAAVLPPTEVDAAFASADRAAFLSGPAGEGGAGDVARPAALQHTESLDGRTGSGLDPCFAVQTTLDVPPGATIVLAFALGEGGSKADVADLLNRYAAPEERARALAEVRDYYDDLLGRVQVNTPYPEINLMANGWALYQALVCRIVGRTAFYQSGGAYGFRDQLQDASAFLRVEPSIMRRQLLLHAAHQFPEGDVLHWWHEPGARGLRTRFADDLVWLPYLLAEYVEVTGDRAVLDEPVPFRKARLLEPGEDEVYLATEDAGIKATLYEHAARALDRAMTRGTHGLPLFGTGDWNDGMNRVGREGKGESVWMAFFLASAIDGFAPISEARGEAERAARYRKYRSEVVAAVEEHAWDGDWYLRGFYDDGTPLGSARGTECRIDALVQAWATLSGAAQLDRAARALNAVEKHLVEERAGIIRLLDPPFDFSRDPHDPGYIKGYVPGVRENGGQYTHAALWVIAAVAKMGPEGRAEKLLAMLSPVTLGSQRGVARYKIEPYVLAADVYGANPHIGRGGWTWYTGSAGWYARVAAEVLGS